MAKREKRACVICGKKFWSQHGTNVCSAACRRERKRYFNSEDYKRKRRVGERMTEGEVARMMTRYHLKKHDDAVAASGYAPKVERRDRYDANGRKWHYESRGRIPAGGMV